MGGTRLPGKVLLTIGGIPVIQHVVERVLRAVPHVVVAIPDTPGQGELRANLPSRVNNYAGSESDVLARYWGAALQANADIIVRVTADCPFVDPYLITRVAALAVARHHYVRTDPRLPRGLDVEAFTIGELAEAMVSATGSDREHVCPWMARRIPIPQYVDGGYPLPNDGEPRLRWTLDTTQDYDWFRRVAAEMDVTPPHPTPHELFDLLARKPELIYTEDTHEEAAANIRV